MTTMMMMFSLSFLLKPSQEGKNVKSNKKKMLLNALKTLLLLQASALSVKMRQLIKKHLSWVDGKKEKKIEKKWTVGRYPYYYTVHLTH